MEGLYTVLTAEAPVNGRGCRTVSNVNKKNFCSGVLVNRVLYKKKKKNHLKGENPLIHCFCLSVTASGQPLMVSAYEVQHDITSISIHKNRNHTITVALTDNKMRKGIALLQ